jgi:hypothetical protein
MVHPLLSKVLSRAEFMGFTNRFTVIGHGQKITDGGQCQATATNLLIVRCCRVQISNPD